MLGRAALIGSLVTACSSEPSADTGHGVDGGPGAACFAGERSVEGHGCVPAGVRDDGCAAGETNRNGGCEPAGVPADEC